MANTLGTLAPSLVAQRTLDYLKVMFPAAFRLFIDFTPQQVYYNGTIKTRIPGSTAAYDAAAGYAAPDVTDVDVSITVDKFKAASVKFTSAEMSSTNRDLVNEHAAMLANQLGKQLIADMFALFLEASFTNVTDKDAVDYDDATLRAIRKALSARNVADFGRLGIVNGDAFEALQGDALVTTQLSNPAAQEGFQMAPSIIRARGFEIMEFPTLPANGENLNGIFMAPGALVGAVGVPVDANAPGMFDAAPNVVGIEYVTDEDTGLSLIQRLHKNSNGGVQMDVAWIYGFKKGNAACAQLVQEAA